MLKKIAKKIAKGLGILVAILIGLLFVLYLIYNKPLPKGITGAKAEALAQKMLKAVNKEAWDTTNIIQWSFVGSHHFVWDRTRNFVQVEWDNYRVLLNAGNKQGKIFMDNKEQAFDQKTLDKAYSYYINDAFWMNGYTQIYNGNPEHRIVDMGDGTEGLLVTYKTGGVTPGDSYLWILDENGLPIAWRMWVGIIPIGGVYVTWQDWQTLPSGAKIATNHYASVANISITDIKTYQTWEEGGFDGDIFEGL